MSERKTRTVSYAAVDDIWFSRLKKDGKKYGRPMSVHLLWIIKDHFSRQRMLERINKERDHASAQ